MKEWLLKIESDARSDVEAGWIGKNEPSIYQNPAGNRHYRETVGAIQASDLIIAEQKHARERRINECSKKFAEDMMRNLDFFKPF